MDIFPNKDENPVGKWNATNHLPKLMPKHLLIAKEDEIYFIDMSKALDVVHHFFKRKQTNS
jgi:hypothetical protein